MATAHKSSPESYAVFFHSLTSKNISVYEMSVGKEGIQIIESKQSNVAILHLDSFYSVLLALVIGIMSFIGMFIKGLFLYYVECKAPKGRPINKMIFFDQVLTY